MSAPRRRFVRVSAVAALSVWMALASACSFAPPRETSTMKAIGMATELPAEQVRIRVRAMIHPLSGILEGAADRVIAEAKESSVRREALIWKLDGVPAVREALFRPDPLASLLDTWALGLQMTDFFENGPGAERLGDWSTVAVDASRRIVSDVSGVTAHIFGEDAREFARAFIVDWAAAHPIENTIEGRETVLEQVTEFEIQAEAKGMRMLGSMAVSMDDLARRVEVYSDQLLRQWRWQVQLLGMEATGDPEIEATLQRLPPLLDSLQRTLAAAQDAPDLIARERALTLSALNDELERVLQHLTREREAVLAHLTEERTAVLREVEGAGAAAGDRLRAELEQAVAQLSSERDRTLQDVEAITMRTIDHAYYRAAQLAAAAVLALLVGIALGAWLFRRRPA